MPGAGSKIVKTLTCDDCRKRRTAELAKKSRQKRLAREARIRAKIANEKNKGGISCSITPNS